MPLEQQWATLTPAELYERVLFCRDRLGDKESERIFQIRAQIASNTRDFNERLRAEQCTHEWALLIDGPGEEALYACAFCPMNWNTLEGPLP